MKRGYKTHYRVNYYLKYIITKISSLFASFSCFAILIFTLAIINFGCNSSKIQNSQKLLSISKLKESGNTAYKNSNYIKATQCYIDALLDAEEFAPDKVEEIQINLANNYIEWARNLYWTAKENRSIKMCKKAVLMAERASTIDTKRTVHCKDLIKKLKNELTFIYAQENDNTNSFNNDLNDRSIQIKLMLKQGYIFAKHNQYTQAVDRYENVMIIDPFNLDAIRALRNLIKQVNTKPTPEEELDEIEKKHIKAILKKRAQDRATKNL